MASAFVDSPRLLGREVPRQVAESLRVHCADLFVADAVGDPESVDVTREHVAIP